MEIRRVSWMPFRLPMAGVFATAHGTAAVRTGVIVQLAGPGGVEGFGEAAPVPAFGGGTFTDTLAVLDELLPRLAGRALPEADALLAGLDFTRPGVAAAACAIDTALCDLRARTAGVPLATLLGGNAGMAVPVNATIGVPEVTAACLAARRAAEAGFRCVKLKVGVMGGHQLEIARIAAVRGALGPHVRLRLDANGAWSVDEAITIIREASRYDLELVEQPVAAMDLAGMARLRQAVDTPIAADEAVGGPEQAAQVVAAGAADVLIVKPMLAGGLRRAQAVIGLARAAGLEALVTTTIDTGIGIAAALHLATTLPPPRRACGLATAPLLSSTLVEQPLIVRDGAISPPAAPGLGVTLDVQQITRYGGGWRSIER